VHVSMASSSGLSHRSHNPAKAKSRSSRIRTKYGCFPRSCRCHSKKTVRRDQAAMPLERGAE
jgi:hypothetical protein